MDFTDVDGITHRIFATKALAADLTKHSDDFDCAHISPEAALRRRTVAGGGVQIIRQCPKCGVSVGGAVKKAPEHASVPAFDEAIALEFEAQKQTAYREILARHLALQLTGKAEHQKEYAAYRETPEWGAKRGKVLERAQGLCEGCRENPAAEIHHLTYDHIYSEFLFELVAVRHPCHSRLHGEDGREWTEFCCREVE